MTVRNPIAGYAVSLAVVAAAVAVRFLLEPLLGDRLPFIMLYPAVAFAAWYGGRGPAVVALVAGALAAAWFHLDPRFSFAVARPEYRVGLVLFVIIGVASIAMFDSLRAAAKQGAEKGELLETALTSMGDAVVTTDAQMRITSMNTAAELLTGWSMADARAQPLASVYRVLHEETRQPVENPVARALGAGVIVGVANHTILVARNGTERPIEDSAAPIRRKAKEIIGCVLVFRDVSDRRQQERELTSREEQFHTLAESMPQLVWMANPDGHIFWYNRGWYEYTGTTFEAMAGWGWQSVHDPHELPKVLEEWRGSIATGETFEMVFPIKGKDGVFHPFLTRVVPVKDDQGRVRRWFGTNTDVTAAKEAEEALRTLTAELSEADHRKDEFLATLAHELRNPLAPLKNSLELMKHAGGNAELMERARGTMERQVGQMVRLIDDLLDVSRITSNKLELKTERVELSSVVHQAVEGCQPSCERLGHRLDVALPPEPIFLQADPVRLSQVFGNLLANACKYTERGGRLSLTAVREGSDAVVKVTDSGVGIPPGMLHEVFELFAQVDRTLDRSEGGLGIGLSLVKRLVEMHGGTVSAHSEGLGRGSEFIVRLPVLVDATNARTPSAPSPSAPSDLSAPSDISAPAGEPQPTSARRILVVDDNRDSAASLATLLSLTGNDTRTAHDGAEAMERAAEFAPDLILLDIGLPKMSGYEVCRAIRAQPWGRDIAVVALTGWGQGEARRKSKEAGFSGHMVKPVDHAELMKLVAGLSPTAREPARG